jgi:hypothetical protein
MNSHQIIALAGLSAALILANPLLKKINTENTSASAQNEYGSSRSRHNDALILHSLTVDEDETWIDGDNIAYYSTTHLYTFERPYRWQGRSNFLPELLQSSGFTPFKVSFRGRLNRQSNPEEEIEIIVESITDGTPLDTVVAARKAADSTVQGTSMHFQPASSYTTSDGAKAVSTVNGPKAYHLILRPIDASERLQEAFSHAKSTFRFIDRNLKVR